MGLINDFRFTIKYKKNSNSYMLFAIFKTLLCPSFIVLSIYRFGHLLNTMKIPILPKICWWINYVFFSVDIDIRAKLWGGIYMPHPIGIVIGQGVIIMGDTKILHGATLGGNLGKKAEYDGNIITQPVLIKGGLIGINSVIAGPVIITGKVFVSANSIITGSVGEDAFLYDINKKKNLQSLHKAEMHYNE